MLLAIDIGNTNIVVALFDAVHLKAQWRLNTHPIKTADELVVMLSGLFQAEGFQLSMVSGAVIASVVPAASHAIKTVCQQCFRVTPLCVGEEGVSTGIEVLIDHPSELGADRIVNAIAAQSLYGNPLIIVDLGTATTFDVVDEQGRYRGGVIAPGIHLSMKALHMGTAQLPAIDIQKPNHVIGTNTQDAMLSGVYFGYVHAIEGLCQQIKAQAHFDKVTVVATGGLASLFADGCASIDVVEPHLTMLGLRLIYERNL